VPTQLRLSEITFCAGERSGEEPLHVQTGDALIIVGPNNSGKSLALREIEGWCLKQASSRKVIQQIEVLFPDDPDAAVEMLKEHEASPPPGEMQSPDHFYIGLPAVSPQKSTTYFSINPALVKTAVQGKHQDNLRTFFTRCFTIRLDGRTRFSLSETKDAGDFLSHPQNHLWALFVDDSARDRVRRLTEEAFGLHFVIDPTKSGSLRIRMSSRAPATKAEEQALDETARRFHQAATPISELSDGVQAFVGLTSAVLSVPHKIMLIDEPEAFLHPTLARRLGTHLSQISREREASLVVATHSAEFLRGCLEVSSATAVVRVTYENGVATARTLPSDELVRMMRHPLLRSTGLFQGLFHRAVVVTEADTDRAFYDEMNRRLNATDRGIKDALFLNAQNKHTIHTMIKPLRQLGIPAAAIVDLDVIKEGGTNWQNLLKSCQVDIALHSHLQLERSYLNQQFTNLADSGRPEALKHKGLAALRPEDKMRGELFLADLSKYGLFIVPNGELEAWLADLGVSGHGPEWLVELFSRIGQSESEPTYLHPATNNVWKFLEDIAAWVHNSSRSGT
jgi:ABC-type polar amino acid transport system ATPase subunit